MTKVYEGEILLAALEEKHRVIAENKQLLEINADLLEAAQGIYDALKDNYADSDEVETAFYALGKAIAKARGE